MKLLCINNSTIEIELLPNVIFKALGQGLEVLETYETVDDKIHLNEYGFKAYNIVGMGLRFADRFIVLKDLQEELKMVEEVLVSNLPRKK